MLAHYLLNERLNLFGLLGGMLCVAGSLTIVLHAPEETPITSVVQVWQLAMQPGRHCAVCEGIYVQHGAPSAQFALKPPLYTVQTNYSDNTFGAAMAMKPHDDLMKLRVSLYWLQASCCMWWLRWL